MRVLVLADYFPPAQLAGGAVRTLSRLVPTESTAHDLRVLSRDHDLNSAVRFPTAARLGPEQVGAIVDYLDVGSLRGILQLLRAQLSRDLDVVYLNSLFSPVFSLLPILVLRSGARRTPVLVAPRGECHPAALAIKSWKKRPVSILLRRVLRSPQVIWHASTEDEAADIRVWAREPVQVIIACDPACPPEESASEGAAVADSLRVACVTRIVPKKDIRRLLEIVSLSRANLDLHLYGPIEDVPYWESQCMPLMEKLPPNVEFTYHGPIRPEEVSEILHHVDLMLFPTRGENFGHVIAEAMAVGCPVLTTPTTAWTEHIAAGQGLIFTTNQEAAEYLDRYAATSSAQRSTDRAACLSAYRDWYVRNSTVSSLFTGVGEISTSRFVPRQRKKQPACAGRTRES